MKTASLVPLLAAIAAAAFARAAPTTASPARRATGGAWGPAGLLLRDASGTANHTVSFNGFRDALGYQVLSQQAANGAPARAEQFYFHPSNVLTFAEGYLLSADGYLESADHPGRCIRARTFDGHGSTTHFDAAPCATSPDDSGYDAQFFFLQGQSGAPGASNPGSSYFLNSLLFTGDPSAVSVGTDSYHYQLSDSGHQTVEAGYQVPSSNHTLYFDFEITDP